MNSSIWPRQPSLAGAEVWGLSWALQHTLSFVLSHLLSSPPCEFIQSNSVVALSTAVLCLAALNNCFPSPHFLAIV